MHADLVLALKVKMALTPLLPPPVDFLFYYRLFSHI